MQIRRLLFEHQIEECIYFGHNQSVITVFTSNADEHAVKRHHALTELIQQEADRRAPLTFARFMELALYTPALGFYEQRGKPIGRQGDFFTSVSVGPLFGELLACQFTQWLGNLPASRPIIVEVGAHDGQLAQDVLTALARADPKLFARVEYWILEPSVQRRHWQNEKLAKFSRHVRWFESWTELYSFRDGTGQGLTGIIFANELLDALPVHRLHWDRSEGEWRECVVIRDGPGFSTSKASPGSEVAAYGRHINTLLSGQDERPLWPNVPKELLAVLPDGFTIEICPSAMEWWRQAGQALTRGWLLTLDYGLQAEDCFAPHRANGTIRAYHEHRATADVLARPGQQDLTAHVNFTALELAGKSSGLVTDALTSQSDFLTASLRQRAKRGEMELSLEQIRQFQTLTHPDHLGRAFKVLVQSRGITAER